MHSAVDLSKPEIAEKINDLAVRFKAPVDLHPEDLLFKFFADCTPGVEALDRYFSSGWVDAERITTRVKTLLPEIERPKVLEFAAGFGRVTRHFRRIAPHFELRMSDIHAPAVKFAKDVLDVEGFKSEPRPEFVPIEHSYYDFIFALSFFSHAPDATFADWLCLLYSALRPGGVLLFTTHGETSMKKYEYLAQLYSPRTGFGYGPASDQSDIEGENYGSMSVDFDYTVRQIHKTSAEIISYSSGAWWGHQDEWIVRRAALPPCEVEDQATAVKGQPLADFAKKRPGGPVWNLDTVGNDQRAWENKSFELSLQQELVVSGWAVDDESKRAAGGVDIVIDDTPYAAQVGVSRPDVAGYFGIPDYADSGFVLRLPMGHLAAGPHQLFVRVLSRDRQNYWEMGPYTLIVK
ncbi:MAG: class I SAM-dependent methyltransferase [Acidobacteriia bacterium]|nr:class I SAM-dependent methyltransferase [Terriglobia bacterium]